MAGVLAPKPIMGVLSEAMTANPMLMKQLAANRPMLGTGLTIGGMGIAPYGLRHSGLAPKGKGFFGPRQGMEGYSTEISTEDTIDGKPVEYPLMNPALSASQMKVLLSGAPITDDIYEAAKQHAAQRIKMGLSPFSGPMEMRTGLPK